MINLQYINSKMNINEISNALSLEFNYKNIELNNDQVNELYQII